MRRGGIAVVIASLLLSCGNDGPAGPAGAAGTPGAAGAAGATGPAGAAGQAGVAGGTGAAGEAGAPGAGVLAQWVDANGAPVKVVTSSVDDVYFLDGAGHVWAYATNDESVHVTVANIRPVFTSGDCSGTAYVFALAPGFTFTVVNDATLRVRPATQAMTSITVNSQTGIGGVGCSTLPGITNHVVDPAGLQTIATMPTIVAPLHPVAVP